MSDLNPVDEQDRRHGEKVATPDDIVTTLRKYARSAGRKQLAHYLAAEADEARHSRIGVPNVVLSAIVATSVFSTLTNSVNLVLRVVTGVVAIVAAVLAALQAFLRYGDRAEKHRAAGARYAKVRIDVDFLRLRLEGQSSLARAEALADLGAIAEELGSLETDSPTLTNPEYDAGQKRFDQEHPELVT